MTKVGPEDFDDTFAAVVRHLEQDFVPTKKAPNDVSKPVEYFDVVLLHWPNMYDDKGKPPRCLQDSHSSVTVDASGETSQDADRVKLTDKQRWQHCRQLAWKGLERLVDEGITRFIGVSNFHVDHLDPLFYWDQRNYPIYANEIEYHPFVTRPWEDTKQYCEKKGIRVIAYGSMGGLLHQQLADHYFTQQASARISMPIPETLLMWGLENNVSIIPGSLKRKHMDSSLKLDLDDALAKLDGGRAQGKIFALPIPQDERIKCYQPDAYYAA